MDTFQKAFNRNRNLNGKKRTLLNIFRGLNNGYLPFYIKAQGDFNKGELKSALVNISKTIEKSDTHDWKHFAFRANLLEDLCKYNEAIKDYERAVEYAETDSIVYSQYHQIGFCYFNLSDNLKAIEFYGHAIDLKIINYPHGVDQEGMDNGVLLGIPFKRMYNNRANAYFNLNKLNEAFEDCMTSLSYDKNYSNPYFIIAQIYSKRGDNKHALEALQISAKLGNDAALTLFKKS